MSASAHDLGKLRIDRDQPAPTARRSLAITMVLAAAALAAIVLFVVYKRGQPIPVQVVVAAASDAPAGGGATAGATSVTANGYVVARTRASVSSKVAGRLAFLGVAEGSFVRAGALIGRLENADYGAQVSLAEANVASARARVVEAEADHAQQEREARRLREIRERNANLISPQDVDVAETRAATARARSGAAIAAVTAAEAGLRFARVNMQNTEIVAPFTGTVLRKEAEVGEVVAPSVGGGLTRGAVVTMADLASLEVEVDVNEAYIARITSGQPARITLDAYPDTSFAGNVRQVVPTADRQRATVQVKVAIVDRDPRILPEMGARVDFLEPAAPAVPAGGAISLGAGAPAPPRVRVPAAAVREQGGRSVVFVVREGRLVMRPVEAGPASGGFREVRTGLAGGEQLLVGGVETPRDGLKVRATNQNNP